MWLVRHSDTFELWYKSADRQSYMEQHSYEVKAQGVNFNGGIISNLLIDTNSATYVFGRIHRHTDILYNSMHINLDRIRRRKTSIHRHDQDLKDRAHTYAHSAWHTTKQHPETTLFPLEPFIPTAPTGPATP
jgi:hypothetical protein